MMVGFSDYLVRNRPKVMGQIGKVLDAVSMPYMIVNGCKDMWLRDFMPCQRHDGKLVKFRYSPDYLRGAASRYITDPYAVSVTLKDGKRSRHYTDVHQLFEDDIIETDLIIDGGNIIRCVDKNGCQCVLMTQKVLYENRGISNIGVLAELERVFRAEVILLPWDCNDQFGHADGMVRSLSDGNLLFNCYSEMDKALYYQLESALSGRFVIHELKYGDALHDFSWCHINYLELDDIVMIPALGIPSDELAKSQLQLLIGKTCHLIYMPEIVLNESNGGGAMNCISWDFRMN